MALEVVLVLLLASGAAGAVFCAGWLVFSLTVAATAGLGFDAGVGCCDGSAGSCFGFGWPIASAASLAGADLTEGSP